jgi:hypothetical protein
MDSLPRYREPESDRISVSFRKANVIGNCWMTIGLRSLYDGVRDFTESSGIGKKVGVPLLKPS